MTRHYADPVLIAESSRVASVTMTVSLKSTYLRSAGRKGSAPRTALIVRVSMMFVISADGTTGLSPLPGRIPSRRGHSGIQPSTVLGRRGDRSAP